MDEIFSWGYEAPVMNDYSKNNASICNKIRKMKRPIISENHDNYRKPLDGEDGTNEQLLFNYFDLEELDRIKKMIYDRIIEDEREQRNTTQYKETMCKGQRK